MPGRSPRRWWHGRGGLILTALVVAAAYAATVAFYAADLRGTDARYGHIGEDVDAPVVLVLLPRALDPVSQELSFQLQVAEGSALIDEDGTGLTETVHLEIRDAAGGNTTKSVVFDKDALTSQVLVTNLTPQRRFEAWPFDSYGAAMTFAVAREPVEGRAEPLGADFLVDGGVPGWDLAVQEDGISTGESFTVDVQVNRAFSTLAFAIVLLTSMSVLAVIALLVSVGVFRGRRRMELVFLTWIAGMLFAVPALRNFFPGQPPIGSWVDFLIVLWVIVGLVISLVLIVVSWFRATRVR